MKVFIGSLMSGHFASMREAAAIGIRTLGYELVMAEDFRVSPDCPLVACLDGVRTADAVVLILGSDYGDLQASGKSATHEEYLEAKEVGRPVLAFVEDGANFVGEQAAFVREVRDWKQGQYTESFSGAEDLRDRVIQGLHRLAIALAAAPLDGGELAAQAKALLPERSHTGQAQLVVAIAGGPIQQVIRPAALEEQDLLGFLQSEALTGPEAVLDLSSGTDSSIKGSAIVVEQPQGGAAVSLSETGSFVVTQPAIELASSPMVVPVLVKEEIAGRISRALRLAGRVLDRVDPQHRISHIAVAAGLLNAGYLGWTTRQERNRNPSTATMNPFGQDRVQAELTPSNRVRAALLGDSEGLANDLAAVLRRKATESPYR